MIKEAVKDKRLARPLVIPIKVDLTNTLLLRRVGRTAGLTRAWFANVKERKNLINCAKNKLLAAVDIIATKHPSERIMVFSETIESIQMLKELLENKGIKSCLLTAN
jgi:superfamily II DNA/RNA helicase